jgi:hypothetical protein
MGIDRRYRRMIERDTTKHINKVKQQTLDQINKNPPKEREELLMLYKHMLEQREQERINRQNTVIIEEENTESNGL